MEGAEAVRTHAYELAFSSDDELFHSTLYDWLISKGLADELLEVCTPPSSLESVAYQYPCRCAQLTWRLI